MTHKTLIYKLMYYAFLDIRSSTRSDDVNLVVAYRLADVFHNVPLQLNRVENENGDYETILLDIRERAKRAKCEAWIDNVIKHFEK
jgi:hypothetical protein